MTVSHRVNSLKKRNKIPLIYHSFNVSIEFAALNVMTKLYDVNNASESRIVILVRHEKMPLINKCDVLKVIRNVNETEGKAVSFKTAK